MKTQTNVQTLNTTGHHLFISQCWLDESLTSVKHFLL